MPESVVNLKVEIVVSQLYQVGVATSYDVAQGNFDELITVYTIFIKIAIKIATLFWLPMLYDESSSRNDSLPACGIAGVFQQAVLFHDKCSPTSNNSHKSQKTEVF